MWSYVSKWVAAFLISVSLPLLFCTEEYGVCCATLSLNYPLHSSDQSDLHKRFMLGNVCRLIGMCWTGAGFLDWDSHGTVRRWTRFCRTSSPTLTACVHEAWEWPPPPPTTPHPIPYLNWPNRVYSIQPQRISAEVCAPSNHANGVHLLDLQGDAFLSSHLSYVKHFWSAMSACWLFTVNFMMSHSLMIYTELLKPFVIFRIIHGHWGALLDGMLYVKCVGEALFNGKKEMKRYLLSV